MRRSALSESSLTGPSSPSHLPSLFCQQISAAVCFPRLSSLASGPILSPQFIRLPQPLSCQLAFGTQALVSLRPRRSARAKGPSLDPFHDLSPPSASLVSSPPRSASVLAQHRPSPVPRIAGTAPALSRPLALCASGSASSGSPAFVGLAPSRANAIGVEGSPGPVIAQPVRSSSSPFVYLSSAMTPFPPPSCHCLVAILIALTTHTIQMATRRYDPFKYLPFVCYENRIPRAHPTPSLSNRLPARNASVSPFRLPQAPFLLPFLSPFHSYSS